MPNDAWFALCFVLVCAALFVAMMTDKLLDVMAGIAFVALVILIGGVFTWAFFSFLGAVRELVKPR